MPFSMSDLLAAYGGSPDPENPSSGDITPGLLLRALGHVAAPGQVAPPIFDPDRIGPQGSAFTPAMTAQDYASQLSAGKNKPPDPLETMLGVAGGSPATFIGPGALTWNRQAAAEAERMLAAGASRREIEAKTGTSFNAAMQPQQERSDASMTVDMNRVARAIEGGERSVPASEIYKDWQLFRDYPDMAQWPVDLNNPFFQGAQFKNQKVLGAMDMGLNPPALLINPREMSSAADIRSMGGHELAGHGVSRIEGFPSGGGFETPVVVQQAERTLPARVEAYQKTMKDVGDRAAAWALEQTGGDRGKAATVMHQYFELNPDEARLMSGALQEKAKYNRGRMGLEERFKAYESLAGENDARNIQKRLDMTQAQLEKTSREDTQDIPFADQLIHFAPYTNEPLRRPQTQGDFGFSMDLPSFSERMTGARDVAFAGRQRGTGNILPRSTANEAPLLAPGETMGDLQGALTPGMAPAQESIADVGRRSYRERLGLEGRQFSIKPTTEMTDIGEQFVLPGAERLTPAQMAQRKAAAPLKADVGQKPADEGLFAQREGEQGKMFLIRPADVLEGYSMGDVAGPSMGVGAPYVRNPNAPLFDYARLGERIDTPQFGLTRTKSTDVQPDYLRAGRAANVARVNKIVEQGIKEGGLDWHGMTPLLDEYVGELGSRAGPAAFNTYMDRVGATSPNSNVKQNFRTASYYDYLLRNGLPLPEVLTSPKGNPYIAPGAIPSPYGNKAQGLHVMNLQGLESGAGYPLSRPKPPSFAENMKGNYTPVAIDRHNLNLWGIDSPEGANLTGYRYLEELQQEQARRMGILPGQYQAAGWLPYAQSGAEPALKLFEQRIAHTAELSGLTKERVLREFIRGKMRLQ